MSSLKQSNTNLSNTKQTEPQTNKKQLEPQTTHLLEQAIIATKQTEPSYAKDLLNVLTHNALEGTVTWSKSFATTINTALKKIDATISKQLNQIMHHEQFKKLEGAWRGLHHLVLNSETNHNLKIRILNVNKREIFRDLDRAVEFDQSQLFKKLYENEFGMPGGEPYGLLVGDYEFNHSPEDIDLLRNIYNVSAAAFAPFVTASSHEIFGFESWSDLSTPRDLEKIFSTPDYAKWRSFRDSEDSRFIVLTMPRALARLPYGKQTQRIESFDYEESSKQQPMAHSDYCWMNSAYLMASNITKSQAKYGWSTAIRGAENGGKVENLPLHTFISDDGDIDAKCPTEIGITDRREAELSKLGFLPLCHYKNTDYAVYFGASTVHKAKKYDTADATANAAISARLPYIMATSRFAHYLKVMTRDKIGSFMEASDCETWLNRWILNYVNANASANEELKAQYPLASAKVTVKEILGQPGCYNAVAYLQPWLQLEELTTSMRLVAKIPQLK